MVAMITDDWTEVKCFLWRRVRINDSTFAMCNPVLVHRSRVACCYNVHFKFVILNLLQESGGLKKEEDILLYGESREQLRGVDLEPSRNQQLTSFSTKVMGGIMRLL